MDKHQMDYEIDVLMDAVADHVGGQNVQEGIVEVCQIDLPDDSPDDGRAYGEVLILAFYPKAGADYYTVDVAVSWKDEDGLAVDADDIAVGIPATDLDAIYAAVDRATGGMWFRD